MHTNGSNKFMVNTSTIDATGVAGATGMAGAPSPAARAASAPKAAWLPLVVVVFTLFAGIAAFNGMLLAALLCMAAAVGAILLVNPDAATVLVVFVIYTNLAVLGIKFHGMPSIVAILVTGTLGLPLFHHVVVRREKIIIPSGAVWFLLFIVVLMIGTLLSKDVPTAFDELVTFFTEGFVLYLLITNVVRSSVQMRWVIWALLAAGIVLGGVPLFQQVTGTFDNTYGGLAQTTDASFRTGQLSLEGDVRQPRLAGAIGEMNRFAQVMLMIIPLGLMRFWGEPSRLMRLVAIVPTVFAGIGMVLPFSRGAAVAFGLMVMLMVFFRLIKPGQLVAFVLVAGLALVLMPQYTARLVSIQSVLSIFTGESTSEETTPDGAIEGRLTEMIAAAQVYADHPLFGVGPGMFRYYSREYSLALDMRYITEDREAHNLILGLAAESGTLGLIFFSAMIIVTLRDLFQVRNESHNVRPDLENLATSFILVLFAYLTSGLFLHLSFLRYFTIMFALASAAAEIGKTELSQTLSITRQLSLEQKGPAK